MDGRHRRRHDVGTDVHRRPRPTPQRTPLVTPTRRRTPRRTLPSHLRELTLQQVTAGKTGRLHDPRVAGVLPAARIGRCSPKTWSAPWPPKAMTRQKASGGGRCPLTGGPGPAAWEPTGARSGSHGWSTGSRTCRRRSTQQPGASTPDPRRPGSPRTANVWFRSPPSRASGSPTRATAPPPDRDQPAHTPTGTHRRGGSDSYRGVSTPVPTPAPDQVKARARGRPPRPRSQRRARIAAVG